MSRNVIQVAAREGRMRVSNHARMRMVQKKIYYNEIVEVRIRGELIESYIDATPYPAFLMLEFVRIDEPLFIVGSYNSENHMVYIITVHWHDPEKWKNLWTRRK